MRSLFAALEDGTYEQNCEVRPHSDKTGDAKGGPFCKQPLEQRYRVLYLLADRKADGFLRIEMSERLGDFGSGSGICVLSRQ